MFEYREYKQRIKLLDDFEIILKVLIIVVGCKYLIADSSFLLSFCWYKQKNGFEKNY